VHARRDARDLDWRPWLDVAGRGEVDGDAKPGRTAKVAQQKDKGHQQRCADQHQRAYFDLNRFLFHGHVLPVSRDPRKLRRGGIHARATPGKLAPCCSAVAL